MSHLPKVTLIHGDYQRVSRVFLNDLIKNASAKGLKELIRLDGRNFTLTSLVEACESDSLLGQNRLVVLENLFANRSKPFIQTISQYLKELIKRGPQLVSNPIVLWEAKLLTATQLKPLIGASVKVFRVPVVIFNFLDNLAPGKQPKFIPLYQHLIKSESPESLLVMIGRQVRLLIQVADPNFKLPPWQLKKLIAQRKQFTDEGLITFHDSIVDLDRRAKGGKLIGDLKGEMLMVLINL